ncbi:hypothetical protein Slin15195_G083380 [Septoria linicola]|uniref:N-acetyltransferase domain-containing protein n=1 Tax=Septoria linicola TaxID=215465 RepID=A0A9Q9EM32_9PEZI|nr:hypothetical protein Slin14017_G085890 [Septoria linicola]USW55019.1 hypothetical protein Slin15195_G083380 [Septoria linicola]
MSNINSAYNMTAQITLPQGLCHTTKDVAVNVLAEAFQDDSFHRYVLATWNTSNPSEPISVDLNRTFFDEMLTQLKDEGALFLGVPDAPMVMVCQFEVVGQHSGASEAGDSAEPLAVRELSAKSAALLQKVYNKGQEVLHVYLVGKGEKAQEQTSTTGKDMLSSLVRLADARGWSMFLEATSEQSRDLFQSLGFRVVHEMNLGRGIVDGDGYPQRDGSGVSVWFACRASRRQT